MYIYIFYSCGCFSVVMFTTLIRPFKTIAVKINNNLQRFLTCNITILDNHA